MNRYGIPKKDSVELKHNVNNSSSGRGDKVEYYKFDHIDASKNTITVLNIICYVVKGRYYGTDSYKILPTYLHNSHVDYDFDRVEAVKINYDIDVIGEDMGMGAINSLQELIDIYTMYFGFSNTQEFFKFLGLIKQITEEEFYNLEIK